MEGQLKKKLGIALALGFLAALAPPARAEAPEYAVKVEGEKARDMMADILRRVPPLKHERGSRWPMILWDGGTFEPQPPDYYGQLLARGLTQHIQLTTNMIPTALLLQQAGSPVIMMQGGGGPWPAQLAGDAKRWRHQLEEGFKPGDSYVHACLLALEGWAIQADNVRRILRAYRDAGVTVDGVWMDWEGDPYSGWDAYEQATHCTRCKAELPPEVLAGPEAFGAYRWKLYLDLIAAYLAAPVKEIFPKCEITNWMIVLSVPGRQPQHWNDRLIRPGLPGALTGCNPVAYGNTVYWKQWKSEWPVDREHVDRFYAHLLLRQVSDDAANRAAWAPWLKSYPWVIRWCPDDEDPKIPVLSRACYREVLRHLWLRDVDGMQIFNARRIGFHDLVTAEVEDAVAVYDEMLAYRDLLDAGTAMNLQVPGPQDEAVWWSGVRAGNRAVVRVFKPGKGKEELALEPWPGKKIELTATDKGCTYLLTLEGEEIHKR